MSMIFGHTKNLLLLLDLLGPREPRHGKALLAGWWYKLLATKKIRIICRFFPFLFSAGHPDG